MTNDSELSLNIEHTKAKISFLDIWFKILGLFDTSNFLLIEVLTIFQYLHSFHFLRSFPSFIFPPIGPLTGYGRFSVNPVSLRSPQFISTHRSFVAPSFSVFTSDAIKHIGSQSEDLIQPRSGVSIRNRSVQSVNEMLKGHSGPISSQRIKWSLEHLNQYVKFDSSKQRSTKSTG